MKLILLCSKLREGLAAVEHAVSDNQNLPILKNVLIKTHHTKVKLAATNLELGITKYISGKLVEEGAITVPLSLLGPIVREADSERIELESRGATLVLKTDNYEAKLQGIDAQEFPIIPTIEDASPGVELPLEVFKNAAEQVVPAAHVSEIRPEISGILFDYQLTLLKLVATDTFRLSEKTITEAQYTSALTEGFRAIIPLRVMHEFLRVFSGEGQLHLRFDPNQILFKNDDVEMISRLIDGEYPDYEAIKPKQQKTEILLHRERFMNALRLVSNFSGKISEVKLRLKDGKTLEVHSANQYLGENTYLIPVKSTGAKFDEIAFNWRYLLDGLKAAPRDEISLSLSDAGHPATMRAPEDASFLYLLMPIKA